MDVIFKEVVNNFTNMKNLHIGIGKLVPKKLRLSVYKDTLALLLKGKGWDNGLCMELPKVLWGLSEDDCSLRGMSYKRTSEMFPELKKFLRQVDPITWPDEVTQKQRIKFLRETIKQMEKPAATKPKAQNNNKATL